uniref:Uncharacterized protein n=1 Tax=Arundo donax TaxID=35708 RepID=A0A0A8Z6U3_ARUDO
MIPTAFPSSAGRARWRPGPRGTGRAASRRRARRRVAPPARSRPTHSRRRPRPPWTCRAGRSGT